MKYIINIILFIYFIYNNAHASGYYENDIAVMSHKYGTLIVAYRANDRLELQEPYYLDPYYLDHSTWNPILADGGVILYNKIGRLCIKNEGVSVPYASSCDGNNMEHSTFVRIPSIQGSFLLQFKYTNKCLFANWALSYYYPSIETCPELNNDVDMGFLWSFVPKVGRSFAAQPLSMN